MTAVSFLATMFLALGLASSGPVKVELQEECVVEGSVVRLGDVALLETTEATGALRSLIVCPAPAEGQSLELSAERLRARLGALLGPEGFVLTGPARCVVRSTAGRLPVEAGGAGGGPRDEPPGWTLERHVRDFVLARLSRQAEQVRLEFDPRDREARDLTDKRYLFKIRSACNEIDAGPLNVQDFATQREDRLIKAISAAFR